MVKKSKKTVATAQSSKELLVAIALSLLLGLGGGYAIAIIGNGSSETTVNNSKVINDDHNNESMSEHMHSTYEITGDAIPSVQLIVEEDKKSGYNVKLLTQNFTFTPEAVNGENIAGYGHAHLYVDGEKIARLYGPYFHYDGTFEGTKTFKVTLNANDHSEYTVNGESITAELAVTHDSSDPDHTHE